jgi:hypothetical protein
MGLSPTYFKQSNFNKMKKQFLCGLLPLIGLLFFTTAKAETVPVGDFIMSDGTFNIEAIGSKQLSLNLAGWHVALDPERGPVFSTEPQMLADSWSALGNGLNSGVNVMTVSGTDIYVGGNFTGVGAGGTAVPGLNYIAKWNGSAWSALGSGLNGSVMTIVVSGTNLYVGGEFTGVGSGGTVLNRIAKWNGSAWSALGSGLDDYVSAIAVSGTDLYVGGAFRFTANGTVGLYFIAKWNGAAWSALGSGLNSGVTALAVSGTNLYVGGMFTAVGAGGTAVPGLNKIAKWNGSSWSALGSGLSDSGGNAYINALAASGTDLYVGGFFNGVGAGGIAVAGLNNIAKWNGSSWTALGNGLDGKPYALVVSGANVYAGGDNGQFDNIAKWNGSSWSALGQGLNTHVSSIAVTSTNIYAGGNFTNVGANGTPVPGLNYIAKWGSGATTSVYRIGDVHPDGGIVYQVSSGGTHGKMIKVIRLVRK